MRHASVETSERDVAVAAESGQWAAAEQARSKRKARLKGRADRKYLLSQLMRYLRLGTFAGLSTT
jgi:hypothetical protein